MSYLSYIISAYSVFFGGCLLMLGHTWLAYRKRATQDAD